MSKGQKISVVPDEVLINKIYFIRGQKIMLDTDLAELYGVETRILKQAVRRNIGRFPEDFMFELTKEEQTAVKEQNEASEQSNHAKYAPFAFSEHGVLMLSSVLNSERAIKVNIQIMRIYTKLKEMVLTHKDILLKLEQLEKKVVQHDENMQMIFTALKQLLQEPKPPKEPKKRIGFRPNDD